jgi:hypothetical protein
MRDRDQPSKKACPWCARRTLFQATRTHGLFLQEPRRYKPPFPDARVHPAATGFPSPLWATAVETAQVFTGQALKSKVKRASDEWLRFFALTSSAFAVRENSPVVPGTPQSRAELIREIKDVMRRENILQSLSSWNNTIRLLHVDSPFVGDLFLLRLDPVKKALSVRAYGKELLPEAQKAYEQMEKETEGEPNTQVVLVAVEDLDSLRKAYPNYYVDTSGFIAAVEAEIGKTNEQPVPQEPEQRDLPLSEVSE